MCVCVSVLRALFAFLSSATVSLSCELRRQTRHDDDDDDDGGSVVIVTAALSLDLATTSDCNRVL